MVCPLVRNDKGIFEKGETMFIVYADIDKEGETCKPLSGWVYPTREEAEKELKKAVSDPDYEYFHAWIEEV